MITVWNATDLGVEPERLGLAGSPTRVSRVEAVEIPERRKQPVEGFVEEIVDQLYEILKNHL